MVPVWVLRSLPGSPRDCKSAYFALDSESRDSRHKLFLVAEEHAGLPANCTVRIQRLRCCCPRCPTICTCRQISLKLPNTKFHENPFCSSPILTRGETDTSNRRIYPNFRIDRTSKGKYKETKEGRKEESIKQISVISSNVLNITAV
jgi:hypothetical protein